MPMIRTIDHNYDYQMVQAIRQLAKDYEEDISGMQPEQMMNFIFQNRQEFGELIVNHMSEWMEDQEWYDQVTE